VTHVTDEVADWVRSGGSGVDSMIAKTGPVVHLLLGNDASDPPEHDKPDVGCAISMIAGRYTRHGVFWPAILTRRGSPAHAWAGCWCC
jgi:hypothetical protein